MENTLLGFKIVGERLIAKEELGLTVSHGIGFGFINLPEKAKVTGQFPSAEVVGVETFISKKGTKINIYTKAGRNAAVRITLEA